MVSGDWLDVRLIQKHDPLGTVFNAKRKKMSRKEQKIFFIHIPKTGGSSVNKVLAESGLKGRSHCQAAIRQGSGRDLMDSDYLSAHIPIGALERSVAVNLSEWRLYSAVRNPIEQLRSHINWQYQVYYKGPTFFYGHPRERQQLILNFLTADRNSRFSMLCPSLESAAGHQVPGKRQHFPA